MARMSKRHFEQLADGIRTLDGISNITRKILAEKTATTLANTNPEFSRERFIEWCMRGH